MKKVVFLFNGARGSRYPMQIAQGLLAAPNVAVAFNCDVWSLGRRIAKESPRTENALAVADYIFRAGDEHFQLPEWDRHLTKKGYWSKTVLLDFSDSELIDKKMLRKCFAYVKRTKGTHGKRLQLGYCALREYFHIDKPFRSNRQYDVAYLFNPLPEDKDPVLYNVARRNKVYKVVKEVVSDHPELQVKLGRLHPYDGRGWRAPMEQPQNNPFLEYMCVLRDAKIVITCQPDHGGGDFRIWEAFASGALVVADAPDVDGVHPYIDGVHYIQLHKTGIKEAVVRALSLEASKRQKIAYAGYLHTLKHHQPVNRVDRLMAHLEGLP